MDQRIFMAYGADALASTLKLMDASGVAAKIPKGARVALKPNLVAAKPAESGATTHPGVVEGALTYLRDHGIRADILEGSWVGDDTGRAFRLSGLDKMAARFGAGLYDLKKDSAKKRDSPIGPLSVCERALNAEYLINLPVLKGHCQTVLTCALKNLKGCIPDSEKRRYHTLGLHRPIAALSSVLTPQLTIVDGICGDLSFEEGGNPVQSGRMLLGEDMVKIDALCCQLMGIDASEVEYIGLAERWGAGTQALGDGDLIELGDPRAAGAFPRASGALARLGRGVTQKDACSACYAGLIHALHRLDAQGMLGYAPPIAIGQGMRGVAFDGVGIGKCADGAAIRVPGCPPTAQAILEALSKQAR